jgi:hypothetical protein
LKDKNSKNCCSISGGKKKKPEKKCVVFFQNVSYGLELASDLIGEFLEWQSQFHLFMTAK